MNAHGTRPRKRAACDRCHGQKLRCPRPSGGGSCSRCQKARVPCNFSESKRGKSIQAMTESQGLVYMPTGSMLENEIAMFDQVEFGSIASGNPFLGEATSDGGPGFDGVSLDTNIQLLEPYFEGHIPHRTHMDLSIPTSTFLDLPTSQPQRLKHSEILCPQELPMIPTLSVSHGTTTESATSLSNLPNCGSLEEQSFESRLLSLYQRLVDHSSTIPSLSIYTSTQTPGSTPDIQSDSDTSSNSSSHSDNMDAFDRIRCHLTSFSIDQTLQHSQTLIDINSDISTMIESSASKLHAQNEGHKEGFSKEPDGFLAKENSTLSSPVDEATILLALSCHRRLSQIWDMIIVHSKEMVNHRIFNAPSWEAKACAKLAIGSFARASPRALMSAVLLIFMDLAISLDTSLKRLSEGIRAYSDKQAGYRQAILSGENSSIAPEDIDVSAMSLESVIPSCTMAIALSAKLIERSQYLREILTNGGVIN